ncbi:hypothetical protein LX15_000212 [Streptoalloteichus tenebrarius]|uniref:Uncharacterized protein n=1 Tax=Streptoalloteichus tenebrarius (strain ATCC 17920 / DSM 40477 / JCM 4838 / CBS 697.72 / NBRC 16177 / NCIMB 11028 / NRRL B-12390 / A12253. 1 / ISP 5477) TaxID=1933 RepID=A0ABT1HLY3_STRSD|nr:hypothetical protein [Streptoalloteichus tenebrarius]
MVARADAVAVSSAVIITCPDTAPADPVSPHPASAPEHPVPRGQGCGNGPLVPSGLAVIAVTAFWVVRRLWRLAGRLGRRAARR